MRQALCGSFETMERFTVEVTLRSKSKAKENDWKPKKTWKQYCKELGAKMKDGSVSDPQAAGEKHADCWIVGPKKALSPILKYKKI